LILFRRTVVYTAEYYYKVDNAIQIIIVFVRQIYKNNKHDSGLISIVDKGISHC